MKKYTATLLIIFGSIAAIAQNKWQTEPYLTKSLSSAAINNVFVETSGGSITVNGVTPGEARIEIYVSPNNNNDITKEELKKRLEENYTIDITDKDRELHATARSKQNNINWKKSVSISFKIYVPQQVATNLTTSGGSIHLSDLTGDQNFATSGGSLHVNNVSGKIKGRTSGGSIKVVASKQDIDLVTSGGSITASNCQGNIRLTTSGGSLHLSQLQGIINATTSGGSVSGNEVAGELITATSGGSINLTRMACSIEASTSAGSVHLQLVELGKYVKLNTSAGHIDIQVPSQKGLNIDLRGNKVYAGTTESFEGVNQKDHVEGKLNGGGITIEAHASNGNVNLKYN
jgi:hypothetical protein